MGAAADVLQPVAAVGGVGMGHQVLVGGGQGRRVGLVAPAAHQNAEVSAVYDIKQGQRIGRKHKNSQN